MNHPKFHIFFDESIKDNKFYLACVLIDDLNKNSIEIKLKNICNSCLSDPILNAKNHKYIHFNEDSPSIRNKIISDMSSYDLDVYIGFCDLNNDKYEENYLQIMRILLRNILIKRKDSQFIINYEQNNKISSNKIKKIFEIFNCNSFGKIIEKNKVDKNNILNAIADYYLGVMIKMCSKKRQNFEIENFMYFKPKIRLLYNHTENKYFSRDKIDECVSHGLWF